MTQVTPLVVPQVNVNDDTVLLVRWTVAPDAQVAAGDQVCEVETSKANTEVVADRGGVLVQAATAPVRGRIRETIAAIGPTREAVEAYLASASSSTAVLAPAAGAVVSATAKARALAARHGISLADVTRSGVQGTIKESDVQKLIGPPGLGNYVDHAG